MFLLNSCLDLFSAATSLWHPLSLSYGAILPSSLTMLLPSALGFSPHPPVSVYGTGPYATIAAFLGAPFAVFPTLSFGPHHALSFRGGFASLTPIPLGPGLSSPALTLFLRPHSSAVRQYRNLNLLSIDYASRPRLRPRLTQSRSALLWNPWIFGL